MNSTDIQSGKVYSWYGSELSDAFWKPSWLSLDKDGYLKWFLGESGCLNGVAHLAAIYDKITLENISDYKIDSEHIHLKKSDVDGSNLCPIAIVLRFRIKNLEERVSFAFENKQVLDEWMATFVTVLSDNQSKWIVGDLNSYIKNWEHIQGNLSHKNFPNVDSEACCGVNDETLDRIIKSDVTTYCREQMVPRNIPGQAGPKVPAGSEDTTDSGPAGAVGAVEAGQGTVTMNEMIAANWV